MKRTIGILFIAWCPVTSAFALEEGEPAPKLSIAQWVRGEPVPDVGQSGKNIHVLAFWATWSKPAAESLLELSGLQEALSKSNVVVMAISAEPAKKIEEFLRADSRYAGLKIRIAADDDQKTTLAYMRAAGKNALPHVFVVGRDGVLDWQGHPSEARHVVDEIIAGTFTRKPPKSDRPQTGGEIDTELIAQLREALGRENWKAALGIIDQIITRYPDAPEADVLRGEKFGLLYDRLGNHPAAQAYAKEVLDRHGDRPGLLNNIAWRLLAMGDFERLDHRWPELAHQLAKRAYEASKGEDPGILDTYARSMYLLGHPDRAVELQRRAVNLLREQLEPTDEAEEANLKVLEGALQYYEEVAKLRNTIKP